MAEEQRVLRGPEFKLDLTLIDQSQANIYPRVVLCFKLPQEHSQDAIATLVEGALQRIVNKVPWLASTIKPEPASITKIVGKTMLPGFMKKGGFFGKKTKEPAAFEVSPGELNFKILRDISHVDVGKVNLEDLPKQVWPELPRKSKSGEDIFDGCGAQLNFVTGGHLLLCLSMNHVLADGSTICEVLKMLAEECRALQTNPELAQKNDHVKPLPGVSVRAPLGRVTPVNKSDTVPACVSPKQYTISELVDFIGTVNKLKNGPAPVNVVFTVPISGFEKFKESYPDGADLRFHDFLCGLIFRSVMSARQSAGLVKKEDTVALGQPIDLRRHLEPVAPGSTTPYFGNALTAVQATLSLSELLDPKAKAESGILAGATAMKSAIRSINPAVVSSIQDLYAAATHPALVRPREYLTLGTTSIMFTSWYKFDVHSLDWGSALGDYTDFGRPPTESYDGFFGILPAKPDGSAKVVMTLKKEVMDKLMADETWNMYTTK